MKPHREPLKLKWETMTADERELAHGVTASILELAVSEGRLDPRGKTNEQFQRDSLKYLRKIVASDVDFTWNTDFRGTLLVRARSFRKEKNHEEAVLYYVTWIEHALNSFVVAALRRRKLRDEWVRVFLRETGLRAKYIFAMTSLKGSKPSKVFADRIRALADRRNEFVHYKWIYRNQADNAAVKAAFKKATASAETVVKYLEQFEARHVLRGLTRTRTQTGA